MNLFLPFKVFDFPYVVFFYPLDLHAASASGSLTAAATNRNEYISIIISIRLMVPGMCSRDCKSYLICRNRASGKYV